MSVKSDPALTPEQPTSRQAPARPQAADSPDRADRPDRTDRQVGWLLFALALALYLRTLARDVLPGDPGEFQTAAWSFGLAHATGYPLYLILGGVWQRMLGIVGISPALALNAFSAVTAATTVALFFRVLIGWLPGTPAIRRVAALVGAATLATNPTFWSQALIAEVYALQALLLVLVLHTLQRIQSAQNGRGSPLPLLLVLGLALTHHATTLLLLPGLALALWLLRAKLARTPGLWLTGALLLLGPLLLYFYIPLRATPAASPWYFPRVGGETLALYAGGWSAFRDFVSGRSISVGFFGLGDALANLRQAGFLWRLHFGWTGIALLLYGIYALVQRRQNALLAFSLTTALLLQIFNLFYAIEDILVYYIPLYLLGALWVGFGAAQLGNGFREMAESVAENAEANARPTTINVDALGLLLAVVFLYFPVRQVISNFAPLDQSDAGQARRMWEGILAAEPPAGALLVSNDRNEIVPLYYMQRVEGRRTDLSGIFPLIAPEARFADIGATVATALAGAGAGNVYLVKPMPGLETRFSLQPAQEPLVRVLGEAAQYRPRLVLDQPYGPLTLHGLDAVRNGETLTVRLTWRVDAPVPGLYTTTVQAYDGSGQKVAQNDAAAGGLFYPTSLWKAGELLVENHTLALAAGSTPASLLVGMYSGPDLALLSPTLSIDLSALLLGE